MISVVNLCRPWFLLLIALLLNGCDQKSDPSADMHPNWQISGSTMGTSYHITIVDPDQTASQSLNKTDLQQRVDRALGDVNEKMSTYLEDSELNIINRAPVNQWLPISEPLYRVLKISEEISELSQGAFDITVAPLVNLWGFGPQKVTENVPPQEAIDAARKNIGYQQLQLASDPNASHPYTLRKLAALTLDLSSVAKGYGVDQVAALFDTLGLVNYLIEIGGELRLKGINPRGDKWHIGIEVPSLVHQGAQKALAISGMAVATSGDYRNYFDKDGVRYSHTIDPRSGYPITHGLVSVTVVAETAARADALSTALNVLGSQRALVLAEAQSIAAFFIIKADSGFREAMSSTFAPYVARDQE